MKNSLLFVYVLTLLLGIFGLYMTSSVWYTLWFLFIISGTLFFMYRRYKETGIVKKVITAISGLLPDVRIRNSK